MIFPYSSTTITLDAVNAVSRATGKPHSIKSTDMINPASLSGAIGLRDWADVVANGKGELGHFFVSFYIETEDIYGVVSLSNSKLLQVGEGAYILTNSILGWRDVIVHGLSKDSSTETRRIVSHIFAYLRDNGFASLFSKYRRVNLPLDGSIILEDE